MSVVTTIPYRLPLRAQLPWYAFTQNELSVLLAMVEHCSDGQFVYISIGRIAMWAKMSERAVQYAIHGGRGKPGLIARKVLVLIAPAHHEGRRPATYRIELCSMELDQRMQRYSRRQQALHFAAGETEVREWITKNPGAWKQIERQLDLDAEANVGRFRSDHERFLRALVIAKMHGMPERLARAAFIDLCPTRDHSQEN